MAFIRQAELRTYASRQPAYEIFHKMQEAKAGGRTTVFLSHSHRDRTLALGLKNKLKEQDVSLYIDWEDTAMPDQPNRETAGRIQRTIVDCAIFLFLATQNSLTSRWCSWEIGYADGKKPIDSILIVPTVDDQGTYHGNEYLQLYRRLEIPIQRAEYGVFPPGQTDSGVFLKEYSAQMRR